MHQAAAVLLVLFVSSQQSSQPPRAVDFTKPFVEETAILAEWDGEAANDQFGWIARAAGDLDGDGVTDFVTCAPFKGDAAEPAGRIYAYSTKSRKLLWQVDGAPGDRLGVTVETAGDVNGDGTDDVVATGGGKAHVYSGKDGSALLSLASPGALPLRAASSAGDVNRDGRADGDGHADLAVGAWQYAAAAKSGGRIYVHSGKDGRLLRTITGRIAEETLGFDSVGMGDTDGDGTVDLLVTSAYSGVNGHRCGRVFLVSSGIKK